MLQQHKNQKLNTLTSLATLFLKGGETLQLLLHKLH